MTKMFGKWDKFYEGATESRSYGDSMTYILGAEFLRGLHVEDWGCGLGWFKQFHQGEYVGVDGSHSKFAQVIADLTDVASETDGLFMRHVLEHNHEWKKVLRNALQSFKKRMVLVTFTPFSDETHCIQESVPGIPDYSFRKEDLLELIEPYLQREEALRTKTQYGIEHVFYLEKK
jgi:hypothetical protein